MLLSWTSSNCYFVMVDNGIGQVALNGSLAVTPAQTTIYTLEAHANSGAILTRTVTVSVDGEPSPTVSLTATPEVIAPGGSSALTWSSGNATSVAIDNGIGATTASGSQSVTPGTTTTYTITASGPGGTTSAQATVTVAVPPPLPSAPRSVISLFQADRTIRLDWLAPAEPVTSYQVYRRLGSAAYAEPPSSITALTYSDAAILPNTLYCYAVKAVNAAGSSPLSAETCEMLDWGGQTELLAEVNATTAVDSVAIGDVDGDGTPDLAVGASTYKKGKNVIGKIDLYLGGSTLRSVSLTGGADCPIGYRIALADLNHDGAAEVITGNPACNVVVSSGTALQAGKVFVYAGGATIGNTPAVTIAGTWAWQDASRYYGLTSERLGSTLTAVGDVNGDGFEDVAIGLPYGGMGRSGAIRVLLGSTVLSGQTLFIQGPVAGEYFGTTLAAAGDINGDGRKDIAVGGLDLTYNTQAQAAYVVFGGTTLQRSAKVADSCLVTGLDFNGDGFSDLQAGEELLLGGGSFPSGSRHLGYAATDTLGDLDGNGTEELLSGSQIVFGTTGAFPFVLNTATTSIGRGDWNRDGLRDLIRYDPTAAKVRIHSLAPLLTLPRITLTAPAAGEVTRDRVMVAGTVHGTVARLRVAGQEVTPAADGSFSREEPLVEGQNRIEILAESPGGTIGKQTISVERRPPPPLAITILSPADGTTVNGSTVIVSGTVNDPGAFIRINGTSVPNQGDSTFSAPLALAEGNQVITAEAENGQGQSAAHTIQVVVVTTSVLQGTITNSAVGGPVSAASVTLTDAKGGRQTTLSAPDGAFFLGDIAAGDYTATISKDGFLDDVFSGSLAVGETATRDRALTPLPIAITAVSAASITGTSGVISWSTDLPADSRVEFGVTPGYGQTVIDGAYDVTHRVSLTELTPCTTYHFRVSSRSALGAISSGGDATLTTACPPALNNITVTEITDNGAVITWTTDQPATSLVEYGESTAYGLVGGDETLTTAHTVGLIALTPGTSYHFRVTSVNASGAGQSSQDFTLATTAPPVLGAIAVTAITTDGAVITCTTDRPTTTLVEYGASTAYGQATGDDTLTTTHSVGLVSLVPGTTYHFRVTAVDAGGRVAVSGDQTLTTLVPPPPQLSGITATDLAATSATILWQTDQATDSRVSYGESDQYGLAASDPAPVSSHRLVLTGLRSETTYHFSISSTDVWGQGVQSNDLTFVTPREPLRIVIDAPVAGGVTPRTDILVTGSILRATGAGEVAVLVDDEPALVNGNSFALNHVQLVAGENTITVTARDEAGNLAEATVTVTAQPEAVTMTLTPEIASGLAPLETDLQVTLPGSVAGPAHLGYTGPGAAEFLSPRQENSFHVKMTTPGFYRFTATCTDSGGQSHTDTVVVSVMDRTVLDALLKGKWSGMKEAMAQGDAVAAAAFFAPGKKEIFTEIYTLLQADLPAIAAAMRDIELIGMRNDMAEYRIHKQMIYNGQPQQVTFYLYFQRGGDGFWRIFDY